MASSTSGWRTLARPCRRTTACSSTPWGSISTGTAPTAWPGIATAYPARSRTPWSLWSPSVSPGNSCSARMVAGGRGSFKLGQGDLLVTGGQTQRRFEHCVPKVKAAGARD